MTVVSGFRVIRPTARNELRKVLFFFGAMTFLFVCEISPEPLNGFALNSQGRRVSSLARTCLKVKINFGGVRAVYVWKNIFVLIYAVNIVISVVYDCMCCFVITLY